MAEIATESWSENSRYRRLPASSLKNRKRPCRKLRHVACRKLHRRENLQLLPEVLLCGTAVLPVERQRPGGGAREVHQFSVNGFCIDGAKQETGKGAQKLLDVMAQCREAGTA